MQCTQGIPDKGLRRIILTASGGAFRDWPVEKLKDVRGCGCAKLCLFKVVCAGVCNVMLCESATQTLCCVKSVMLIADC